MSPRPRKRRQYASGSVYQRSSDNRWVGTIEAGWTSTGARRRIVVTAKTEAEVKTKLKLKARDLDRGETSTSPRTTVKAWAETWLEMTERTDRPKTHTTDLGAVRKYIVPVIGHKRLVQLAPADVRAVDAKVREGTGNSSTVRRYHGTLIRMLKAAQAEGYSIPARVLDVKAPAPAPTDRQEVAEPDALAMLAVAATLPHGSRWLAAFLQGMRQGECLGLTWDEVDEDRLSVSWQLQALPYVDRSRKALGFRIPDGYEAKRLEKSLHLVRPKSRAGWRVIPLVPWMAESLASWREVAPASPHGLVWPAQSGSPASARQDRLEWRALQDTVGVRHPSGRYYELHEARHATATLLMKLGVDEAVRIQIMGHSSIASTRGYEHVDVTQARKALERVAERLQLG